jgi:hypothetical protein
VLHLPSVAQLQNKFIKGKYSNKTLFTCLTLVENNVPNPKTLLPYLTEKNESK